MKNDYVGKVKKHMASYKKERLGVDANGLWNKKKPYSHLLPKEHQRLNILEPYRSEFWLAKQSGSVGSFKLHPCFHHLVSSQAMCFNLFFPFLHDKHRHLPILLKVLGLPSSGIIEAVFEKKLDTKEGTAFDLCLHYKDGFRVTFETKYTEGDFGATKQDTAHQDRFRTVYSPMADKTLNPRYREMKPFLDNYQFLRNLIYLGTARNSLCLFILPKADPTFSDVEKRLDDALLPEFRSKAKVFWLEDIVGDLTAMAQSAGDLRLSYHLDAFKEKYLSVKSGNGKETINLDDTEDNEDWIKRVRDRKAKM